MVVVYCISIKDSELSILKKPHCIEVIGESCGPGIETFLLCTAVEEGLVSTGNGGGGRWTQLVTQTYMPSIKIHSTVYLYGDSSNLF